MENKKIQQGMDKMLEGLTGIVGELPNLMGGMEEMLMKNPELAKEMTKAMNDSDIKSKVQQMKKDVSNLNNVFR
jgi:hypothetical protein